MKTSSQQSILNGTIVTKRTTPNNDGSKCQVNLQAVSSGNILLRPLFK